MYNYIVLCVLHCIYCIVYDVLYVSYCMYFIFLYVLSCKYCIALYELKCNINFIVQVFQHGLHDKTATDIQMTPTLTATLFPLGILEIGPELLLTTVW